MSLFHFGLAAAAVWRVTYMLHAEDGPFYLFDRLRSVMRGSALGAAADCFYCLSLWVSIPTAIVIATSFEEIVLTSLALSTVAILIHRHVVPAALPAVYFEEPAPAEEKEITPWPAAEMRGAFKTPSRRTAVSL